MKKIICNFSFFLIVSLILSVSPSKIYVNALSPTPTQTEKNVTPNPDEKKDTIDSLRKKLAEKINQDKDLRLIHLGTLQKIDSIQLILNTFEGKAMTFAYDPSITETLIMGKSKNSTTSAILKQKDMLVLTSDGTSANLALKIIKPKFAEFLFGEIVTLDEENKKIGVVSHITREELEINLGKNTSIYLPEPKSLITKKGAINKLKVGDYLEVVYYPIDKSSDVFIPSKITIIPKELVGDK